MQKILIVIAVFVVLLGLGVTVAQADAVRSLVDSAGQADTVAGDSLTEPQPVSEQPPVIHQLILEGDLGACWYRDEFGRLFSVNEPRHNVVHNCLCRGEYPSVILSSDQQALGMSDAELQAKGYTKDGTGDWHLQTSQE